MPDRRGRRRSLTRGRRPPSSPRPGSAPSRPRRRCGRWRATACPPPCAVTPRGVLQPGDEHARVQCRAATPSATTRLRCIATSGMPSSSARKTRVQRRICPARRPGRRAGSRRRRRGRRTKPMPRQLAAAPCSTRAYTTAAPGCSRAQVLRGRMGRGDDPLGLGNRCPSPASRPAISARVRPVVLVRMASSRPPARSARTALGAPGSGRPVDVQHALHVEHDAAAARLSRCSARRRSPARDRRSRLAAHAAVDDQHRDRHPRGLGRARSR